MDSPIHQVRSPENFAQPGKIFRASVDFVCKYISLSTSYYEDVRLLFVTSVIVCSRDERLAESIEEIFLRRPIRRLRQGFHFIKS